MKIVMFGSQITTGGAQRVLLDQAAWFHAHGHDVRAVFFYDKDGCLSEWQVENPFPISVLSTYEKKKGALGNLSGILRGFFAFVKLLWKEKPQAIECFTHDADLLGIPAAFLAGVPARIGTHHGQFVGMSGVTRSLHTFIVNSGIARKLVCVSARAKQQALEEGVREDRIEVIFNGVDPIEKNPAVRAEVRAELGLEYGEKMILNVGRLTPEKAQKHLITAAGLLKETMPELRFFIAGEGPLHEELDSLIRGMGLQDRFTLLGNRKDVARLLNGADLFVLYSDTEGMPVSMMEAMSAGVPCIGSTLEGIMQLIPDEQYGTLITPGDPELLARTIVQVLEDPAGAEKAAAAAQRIREMFSQESSCKQYEELFQKTMVK